MRATPTAALRDAVARPALSPETDAALLAATARLREAAGDTLVGCIFFGSRRTRAANANAFSAYDLFAVVEAYRPFYEALRRAGLSGKSPGLLAAISRLLPPTQVSVVFREPELRAKVSVVRRDVLARETSARRRDHFTIGRLFQPSRILAARTDEAREELLGALVSAHAETWKWSRPWLPESFDAQSYGRRLLEVSMSWEVRPEPAGRAAALWEAQRSIQAPVYDVLLHELAGAGALRSSGSETEAWSITQIPGSFEKLRLRFYFSLSMLRATARWGKHILSFEGWLDYIVRKASRHTGETIELSERERRWPLVFLWGRVFRYLRRKDGKDPRP
ncbi:MAG: hypothetical protein U0599_29505 [Vicinamibacteria bacterium]